MHEATHLCTFDYVHTKIANFVAENKEVRHEFNLLLCDMANIMDEKMSSDNEEIIRTTQHLMSYEIIEMLGETNDEIQFMKELLLLQIQEEQFHYLHIFSFLRRLYYNCLTIA